MCYVLLSRLATPFTHGDAHGATVLDRAARVWDLPPTSVQSMPVVVVNVNGKSRSNPADAKCIVTRCGSVCPCRRCNRRLVVPSGRNRFTTWGHRCGACCHKEPGMARH